jgi:hypothetical protein
MTEEEFAAKVVSEGGLFEAIFEYGLGSKDLDSQTTVLARRLRKLEDLKPMLLHAMADVEDAMPDQLDY